MNESELARWCIFSRPTTRSFANLRRPPLLLGLVVCAGLLSCGRGADEPPDVSGRSDTPSQGIADNLEYRLLTDELRLAEAGNPYLVFDMKAARLQLRLKGAVVWDQPMEFEAGDAGKVSAFLRRFQGSEGRLVRPLLGKYLFEAIDKTPDSILAIVSRAMNVDEGLLQREIPGRFQLQWEDNLSLEICTPTVGEPISGFKNSVVEMRQLLHRQLGGVSLVLPMNSEKALSLYRAARPGMPTLICPTSSDYRFQQQSAPADSQ